MHALLYIGTLGDVLSRLPEEERRRDADTEHIVVEQFGLSDAHAVAHSAALLPVVRPHRTFILAFRRATHEAQNALLKTLEDPAPTSQFRIIVPREDVLIATVRSRLLLPPRDAVDLSISSAGRAFLDATYGERMQLIAECVKAGDEAWCEEVLQAAEVRAHESHDTALMREVLMVREYISLRGASKKMLMEHLALFLSG